MEQFITTKMNAKYFFIFTIRLSLCLACSLAFAIESMSFQNQTEEIRFRQLTEELRCTVCQNQTLAESDAPLAQDLRQRILEMLQQGQSDMQIKEFLVDRYGDFVLYQPPVKNITILLWFGPIIILFLGAIVVWQTIRKHKKPLAS